MNFPFQAQVFISVVFGTSGIIKFFSRKELLHTFLEIQVPSSIRKPLVWILPGLELLVAGLILHPKSLVVGATGALLLLAGFVVVTLRVMRKKRVIKCNCFGILVPEEFGWHSLIRQTILALTVLFILRNGALISWVDVSVEQWVAAVGSSIGVVLIHALGMTWRSHILGTPKNGG